MGKLPILQTVPDHEPLQTVEMVDIGIDGLLGQAQVGQPLFDLTVWVDVPEAELDRRLMARWAHYGKTPEAARAWVDGNDMPNIRRVTQGSRRADLVLRWS